MTHECTCGAPSDGKWADKHTSGCPAQRADLIQEIAETLSDTCDLDVTWEQYATAVVELLEKRKLLADVPGAGCV